MFGDKKGEVNANYKFRKIKLYASSEWLANGQRKYRTVFESIETSYIYIELSFYNKFFDIKDWETAITLKCYRLNSRKEREAICNIEVNQLVEASQNVIFVREGWGNDELGMFWTRGDYVWEAYIDGHIVGTKHFYVENGGPVTSQSNPYFDIQNVKLYEGAQDGVEEQDRIYHKQFSETDTRYIWIEFNFDNLQDDDWYGEFVFNIYNEAHQLKGQTSELRKIESDEDFIEIISGYGSDNKGSWYKGKYLIEIVFMDRLIAVIPFTIGKDSVGGVPTVYPPYLLLTQKNSQEASKSEEEQPSLEELTQKLNALIGLQRVKKRIHDYTSYLQFVKLRQGKGLKEEQNLNLHLVFKGNPGTGKTTIAKMMGQLYHRLGLLSTGKLYEVGRAELVGQYIGQTAPKVKEAIEKARGGVLFVDEAYSLVRSGEDSKDYGQEVIEVLVKEISDGEGDISIILAGYTNPMQTLLDSNPGLKSRFPVQFEFDDYSPDELVEIAEFTQNEWDLNTTPEAAYVLRRHIIEEYRKRNNSFGNARFVKTLLAESKINLGVRLMQNQDFDKQSNLTKEDLSTLHVADIAKVGQDKRKKFFEVGIDEEALQVALEELNQLIGLTNIKMRINELVDLVRFYKQTKRDIINQFSLHMIFKGNPGTGKTTVARILADIYKALGILERGHLVECDRQGLVAGFVGQTAQKTKEKIESAIGGILFIDEAYALANDSSTQNDYGKEAIETILKQMEDRRGEFVVIAAGYTQNMERFVEINPGLKSRFDKTMLFKDFTVPELYKIAKYHISENHLRLIPSADKYLQSVLENLHRQRDRYFGNARTVRTIVKEAVRQQHLRMAKLEAQERTENQLHTLTKEDIKKVEFSYEELTGKKRVGFGFKV